MPYLLCPSVTGRLQDPALDGLLTRPVCADQPAGRPTDSRSGDLQGSCRETRRDRRGSRFHTLLIRVKNLNNFQQVLEVKGAEQQPSPRNVLKLMPAAN